MVEKPPRELAPSNLAIVGRYILPHEVFDCLERTKPGALGNLDISVRADGWWILHDGKAMPIVTDRRIVAVSTTR